MKQNEWLAAAIGVGSFFLVYTTQIVPGLLFFGYPTSYWWLVPAALAIVAYKWQDLFNIDTVKRKLEAPESIVNRLMADEGQSFREKYDILSFTEFSNPMLMKGALYRFTIKDSYNGTRVLVTSAIGGVPSFLSVYKVGDLGLLGFNTEKEYLNQMLPKDKPNLLDILEELPEDAKAGYAMKQTSKEETK